MVWSVWDCGRCCVAMVGLVGVARADGYAAPKVVFGVEVASSIGRTNRGPRSQGSQVRLKNLVTAGPRLGFAHSNLLFYGTGGWARTDIGSRAMLSGATPLFDAGNSHNSWFAGGGV